MMDQLFGESMAYWIEMDRWAKENKYEDFIQELAVLRFKVSSYENSLDDMMKARGVIVTTSLKCQGDNDA